MNHKRRNSAIHWYGIIISIFLLNFGHGTFTVQGSSTGIIDNAEQGESANQFTVDSVTYELREDATAKLLSIHMVEEVTIPGQITYEGIDYTVTEIADCACFGNTRLKKVTLPDTIKELSPDTFAMCSALEQVVLPTSLERIGERCFYMCRALKYIELPDTVVSIGSAAFNLCTGLTSIMMPASLQVIGEKAFHGCGKITTMEIPAFVSLIGKSAFRYCSNLQEYVVSPESFYFTSHGGVLFNKDMTELIAYPDGKEDASYTIPHGVQCISDTSYGFQGVIMVNKFLREIYVPESLNEIKDEVYFTMETDRVTFYGEKDSYIQQYAASKGYQFQEVATPKPENSYIPSSVHTGYPRVYYPIIETSVITESKIENDEKQPFIPEKIKAKEGKWVKVRISNLDKNSKVTYQIKNKKIVKVIQKGKIYGKKKGKTTLVLTIEQHNNEYRLTSTIIVKKNDNPKKKDKIA